MANLARAMSGLAASAAAATTRPARAVSGVLAIMAGRPRPAPPQKRRRAPVQRRGMTLIRRKDMPAAVVAVEATIKASVAATLPLGWTFDIVTSHQKGLRCWRFAAYVRPPRRQEEWSCDAFVHDREVVDGRLQVYAAVEKLVAGVQDIVRRLAAEDAIFRDADAIFRDAPARLLDYPDVVPAYGRTYNGHYSADYPERVAATISYTNSVPTTGYYPDGV